MIEWSIQEKTTCKTYTPITQPVIQPLSQWPPTARESRSFLTPVLGSNKPGHKFPTLIHS